MSGNTRVGIWGLGVFLPPGERTNDWWPRDTVERWRTKFLGDASRPMPPEETLPDGVARTLRAMGTAREDPFQGARVRRIMPPEMRAWEMQAAAARAALAHAGVAPDEVDCLLSYELVPDLLGENGACRVHHALGLPERCFTLATDGICNSFLLQLTLAEQLIRGGRARRALLVQSCSASRVMPWEEPFSPWFGDGAAAALVGPVGDGRGLLGVSHRADGSLSRAIVCGVPGGEWWGGGRIVAYNADPSAAWQMLVTVADRGRQVVHEALADAGLSTGDVHFYAAHQATAWMYGVNRDTCGLGHARGRDTFGRTGTLSSANVPIQLAQGLDDGALADGDVVAMYSGGSGITVSGAVLRWGR